MEEQLISFKTAKLAKEKGFDEEVNTIFYSDNDFNEPVDLSITVSNSTIQFSYGKQSVTAPTQSLLQKWLREKHNLFIDIRINQISSPNYFLQIMKINGKVLIEDDGRNYYFKNYEECLEKGLQEALKLIK